MFLHVRTIIALPLEQTVAGFNAAFATDQLDAVSADAYQAGCAVLARVGVGPVRKSVTVQALAPHRREDGSFVIALSWIAGGPASALLPVLDANIELRPAPDGSTEVDLIGSYRPPLGSLGVRLDQALLHRFARATADRFLSGLCTHLLATRRPHTRRRRAPDFAILEII